jgi:hypothetical protein
MLPHGCRRQRRRLTLPLPDRPGPLPTAIRKAHVRSHSALLDSELRAGRMNADAGRPRPRPYCTVIETPVCVEFEPFVITKA